MRDRKYNTIFDMIVGIIVPIHEFKWWTFTPNKIIQNLLFIATITQSSQYTGWTN